jgi:hypothetical protein
MGKANIKVETVSESLRPFFDNLPHFFNHKGATIKSARNEIKIFKHREILLCVKSYKKITSFNRLMYSWFRPSKAIRSFRLANLLLSKGIDTPEPLGFVEVKDNWGILRESYYVSFYQNHSFTLSEVLNSRDSNTNKVIKEFAQFMAEKVHPAGIWHNDLSAGNILISETPRNGYNFSIIDLNRIKIKKAISHHKGIQNLSKLTNKPLPLTIMAEEYARVTKGDPIQYTFSLIWSHLSFSAIRRVTKSLLHLLKPGVKKIFEPVTHS